NRGYKEDRPACPHIGRYSQEEPSVISCRLLSALRFESGQLIAASGTSGITSISQMTGKYSEVASLIISRILGSIRHCRRPSHSFFRRTMHTGSVLLCFPVA